jgi:putative sterol carrier protein
MPVADKVTSVAEVFERMGNVFNADKAAGVDVVYQFDLTGDGGGQYWVHVKDGSYEAKQGLHDNPTVTLTASAEDYIKIVNGDMNGMTAVMMGKLKIKGPMEFALKLQTLFAFG